MKTTIPVTFSVCLLTSGYAQTGFGEVWSDDIEREVELRADVIFAGVRDEPEVVPTDRAVWEDAMGAETRFNEEWRGAVEQAIEAGYEKLRAGLDDSECGGCRGDGAIGLVTCSACRGSGLSSQGEVELMGRAS